MLVTPFLPNEFLPYLKMYRLIWSVYKLINPPASLLDGFCPDGALPRGVTLRLAAQKYRSKIYLSVRERVTSTLKRPKNIH